MTNSSRLAETQYFGRRILKLDQSNIFCEELVMTSELFFRVSFVVLWIMLGIVRGYYGRKTKTHDSLVGVAEKLKSAEQETGRGVMILTGIVTAVGGAGLILYLLSPPWWVWTRLPLADLVKWLGIVVAIPPLFYLVSIERSFSLYPNNERILWESATTPIALRLTSTYISVPGIFSQVSNA